MYKNKAIKSVAAVLMLCIFIFSITPKQWLHDIVTKHKDSVFVSFDGKQSLSRTGFHCDCDNLVLQSPFINYNLNVEIRLPEIFVQRQLASISNIVSYYHFFSSLRGPPSQV